MFSFLKVCIVCILFLVPLQAKEHLESSKEAHIQKDHPFHHPNKRIEQDFIDLELPLSAECEPLSSVAGCVNVITGQFFEVKKDLKDNSIEPLHVIHFYDAIAETTLGFGCGTQFPIWATESEFSPRHIRASISEREGFLLPYQGKKDQVSIGVDPDIIEQGYTNLSRAAISGHANFTNWKATFDEGWKVELGDGSKRYYNKQVDLDKEYRRSLRLPENNVYLLTKEIKANGNQHHYFYEKIHDKHRLTKVQALDRSGTTLLNELLFDYHDSSRTIKNKNTKDSVTYTLEEEKCYGDKKRKILKKIESDQPKKIYHTELESRIRKVKEIEEPNGHFLKITYDKGRVASLNEPKGINNASIATYQFTYEEDNTKVKDAKGQTTLYAFDKNKRLTTITQTPRIETFSWSQKEGEEGWLKSKGIQTGHNLHYLKTYDYDPRGNIKAITFHGNLTGAAGETFRQKKETEHYTIHYTYQKDHNLIKEKITPEGHEIHYDYHPGTNLCTKILEKYSGKIQERTFYTYDKNGQIQTKIEDDGSSENPDDLTDVTYRKIQTITSVTTPGASFGKPQTLQESYQGTTGIILLRKTWYEYDIHGNEIKKTVVDTQGNAIPTTKTYDKLLLIEETNALGEVTHYTYDENNNLKTEQHPEKTLHYKYDPANRLIEKQELYKEDIRTTTYSYDALDQLIQETDPYGNTTTYAYDAYGNQTQITKPQIEGHTKHPTITQKYNVLNQFISHTDENGNTTTFTYNIYGTPTTITYPDGTKEINHYYENGLLKQKTKPHSILTYAYDPKGRLIQEDIRDEQYNRLQYTLYTYKGTLLKQTEVNGIITTYQYDAAGRKTQEQTLNHTITYTYDDFDRVIKIQKQNQEEHLTYDPLNRIITKSHQSQGILYAQESYHYDNQDNETSKAIWQTPSEIATVNTYYDPEGRICWQEKPYNLCTTWHYATAINSLEQQVQVRTTIDPMNHQTKETYDADHRIAKKETYQGEILHSLTQFYYDKAGNLTKKTYHIFHGTTPHHEYTIKYDYDKSTNTFTKLTAKQTSEATPPTFKPQPAPQPTPMTSSIAMSPSNPHIGSLIFPSMTPMATSKSCTNAIPKKSHTQNTATTSSTTSLKNKASKPTNLPTTP